MPRLTMLPRIGVIRPIREDFLLEVLMKTSMSLEDNVETTAIQTTTEHSIMLYGVDR